MGQVGGLVACVLRFALVLGVAFGCRGLNVLLLVIFIDRHDKGSA
jgi:hypothetical protein